MASSASQPSIEDVTDFFVKHSALYRELKADDDATTVEGCFLPSDDMPTHTFIQWLDVLARLHEDEPRLFGVREGPLCRSLQGLDNDDGLGKLNTVADYALLPKSLNEALELELAVVTRKSEYSKAIGGYNLVTATSPKPRLIEFLVKDDRVRALLRSTLEKSRVLVGEEAFVTGTTRSELCRLVIGDVDDLIPYTLNAAFDRYEDQRVLGPIESNLRQAMLDGMTGESVSEYGFTPSTGRMLAYASGCIIAGRPIPPAALATPEAAVRGRDNSSNLCEVATDPLKHAAAAGDLDALKMFHAKGWDLKSRFRDLAKAAGHSGSQEAIAWLHALAPERFLEHGRMAFEKAICAGHFATARWMLEALDLKTVPRFLDFCGILGLAAKHNDLSALKWLHDEVGFYLHTDVAKHACSNNNKEMLDWYFSELPADDIAKHRASKIWGIRAGLSAGNLDISLPLLETGKRPFQCDVLEAACKGFAGDTTILDSLVSRLPETERQFAPLEMVALRLGYPHVLEWITKQPGNADVFRDPDSYAFEWALRTAVVDAQTESVRWLLGRTTKEKLLALSDGRPAKPSPIHGEREIEDVKKPSPELLELLSPYYDLSRFYYVATKTTDADMVRRLNALGHKNKLRAVDALLSDEGSEDSEGEDGSSSGNDNDDDADSKDEDYEGGSEEDEDDHDWEVDEDEEDFLRDEEEKEAEQANPVLDLIQAGPFVRPECLPFLRCLVEECGINFRKLSISDACERAAQGGNLEVMVFVLENGGQLSPEVLLAAARCGQLPMCRWLRQQGIEWPDDIIKSARETGADEVAAWIEQEQAKEKGAGSKKAAGGKKKAKPSASTA